MTTATAALRQTMIETAAALLAEREQVTLRRLAAECGTSTMSVYTNFGGMPGLWRAVRQEGFKRLAARLADLEPTDDPVHDAMRAGLAYIANALENPNLYRVMFEAGQGLEDAAQAAATFATMVDSAQRCVNAGRFDEGTDATAAATQLWALAHGFLMLVLTDALRIDDLVQHLPPIVVSALVGFGDERDSAAQSVARAFADFEPPPVLDRRP